MAGKKEEKMELDLANLSGRTTRKDERFALFATRKLTSRNAVLWPFMLTFLLPPTHTQTQTHTHTTASLVCQ